MITSLDGTSKVNTHIGTTDEQINNYNNLF